MSQKHNAQLNEFLPSQQQDLLKNLRVHITNQISSHKLNSSDAKTLQKCLEKVDSMLSVNLIQLIQQSDSYDVDKLGSLRLKIAEDLNAATPKSVRNLVLNWKHQWKRCIFETTLKRFVEHKKRLMRRNTAVSSFPMSRWSLLKKASLHIQDRREAACESEIQKLRNLKNAFESKLEVKERVVKSKISHLALFHGIPSTGCLPHSMEVLQILKKVEHMVQANLRNQVMTTQTKIENIKSEIEQQKNIFLLLKREILIAKSDHSNAMLQLKHPEVLICALTLQFQKVYSPVINLIRTHSMHTKALISEKSSYAIEFKTLLGEIHEHRRNRTQSHATSSQGTPSMVEPAGSQSARPAALPKH